MAEAAATEGHKTGVTGDLVVNTHWARMGGDVRIAKAWHCKSGMQCLWVWGEFDPGCLDALVRLPGFAREVARYSKGVWSSRLRLCPDGFFSAFVPVPPLGEQREIAASIAEETKMLASLRSATENSMKLLKERRASLSAAAIAGMTDVESAK